MAQKFTVPITIRQLSSAGSDALTIFIEGNTNPTLQVQAGGRFVWGSGTSAPDTNLYRDDVNVLKTDDTFKSASLFVSDIQIDTTNASPDDALTFDGTKFVAGGIQYLKPDIDGGNQFIEEIYEAEVSNFPVFVLDGGVGV